MSAIPLRARHLAKDALLCVQDTGRFFHATAPLLERIAGDYLLPDDRAFLREHGFIVEPDDTLGRAAYLYGLAERADHAGPLDYVILVPTLRCNLSCSYCQVSRADIRQTGFDWDDRILGDVLAMLDTLHPDGARSREQWAFIRPRLAAMFDG